MQNSQTGRYSMSEIDNYGNEGGSGKFFSLKEDKEVAKARIMADGLEDIPFYVAHEIEVNGKRTLVKCNRAYGDPIDNCPLCKAGIKQSVKLFIPMYMEEEGVVRFWERGKTFASKLSSLAGRFNPLVNTLFEIERNGAKGSTSTTYETFPLGTVEGGSILNQLPEVPEVIGTFIKDLDNQQMENYLQTGNIDAPQARSNNYQAPQQGYNNFQNQVPAYNQAPQQPVRRYQPEPNHPAYNNNPF